MGQEIETSEFSADDFEAFHERLTEETGLVRRWLDEGRFEGDGGVGGFELEAWLVGADGRPAGVNQEVMARVNSPLVVPELARFNLELNGTPQRLTGGALGRLEAELTATRGACDAAARQLNARMALIGILPTIRQADMSVPNMTPLHRYEALNAQLFRAREGRPLVIDIKGRDHLRLTHDDVMLEAATTSFQIHLQACQSQVKRLYNASIIISGPMVAATANSPYLFDHDLWDETRIPLFEQSVESGGREGAAQGPVRRAGFGGDYVRSSIGECFVSNLEHFPPLLPARFDDPPERLRHMCLHNGTIWRWNRPLIGFDGDRPHVRVEHRVVPGGPTVTDGIANAALYFGLVQALAAHKTPPEETLPFSAARDNFYAAARRGLSAKLTWLDGRRWPARELLLQTALPLAEEGLAALGIDAGDRERYLGIVRARVVRGQNGTAWQRAWVARHGPDMAGLMESYLERQATGAPVHEWPV